MNKLLALAGALIAGILIGRVTAPTKTVTVTEKAKIKVERVQASEATERAKRVIIRTEPGGVKTVTIEDVAKSNTLTQTDKTEAQSEKVSKTVENRSKIVLQGFLGGGLGKPPAYGVGASYRILGPFMVGVGYMQGQSGLLMVGVEL